MFNIPCEALSDPHPQAIEQRNQFENYSYLWTENRAEFLRQFLLYNHVLTQDEIEAAGEDGVPECPPTLEQFKEQVCTMLLILVRDQDVRQNALLLLEYRFIDCSSNSSSPQMDTYENLHDEISSLPDVYLFEQWFRLSIKPFKQNLLNVVRKWSLMFKTHLIDHVTNRCASFSFYNYNMIPKM